MPKKAVKKDSKNSGDEKKVKKSSTKKKTEPKTKKTEKNEKAEKPSKSSKKDESAIQPEINIGLVGHVDHGKTTLTEQLSGKWADTHSEEIKRGITIRLGYADSIFRRCNKCKKFVVKNKCSCGGDTEFVRKVSFVDAPGHESLMATMLAGAMIMDGALLLVAANESCPQPQTREHLMALEIIGIKKVIIVQNKIDLVNEETAIKNYKQIRAFLKGSSFENSPIVPISAQHGANVDTLIETIEEHIPTPKRDTTKTPLMLVARSFDINKPGSKPEKISGGVLGGALMQGTFNKGDEVEIKPGRTIEKHGQKIFEPLKTKIISIKTGGKDVPSAGPGGSLGLMTSLDPSIVKSDSLAGSLVGLPEKLPPVWEKLKLETHLLKRVVGTKNEADVEPIKMGEALMLNVNSAATVGVVNELGKDQFFCNLKLPVCAEPGSRVTISRMVGTRFRLIGYGLILE